MKKLTKLIISICLLLAFVPTPIRAHDFDTNEEYYKNLCGTEESANANKETCKAYRDYLSSIVDAGNSEIDDIKNAIKELEGNIAEQVKKIKDLNAAIAKLNKEIETLNIQIRENEQNIIRLEEEIKVREENIKKIDEGVQKRMLTMQSYTSFNSYIDFIMGAKDFVELIGRIESMNDITEYDNEQMELLKSEIQKLNDDKEALAAEKVALEENKKSVVKKKASLEEAKKIAQELEATYRSQEAELEAQLNKKMDGLQEIRDKMNSISEALGEVASSNGFTSPIASGYRKSAEAWYYPASFGGGVHLGVDLAAPIGTTIRAAGNGVVLARANACPTEGNLGNTCGSPGSGGGGNQVYLLVSIDGGIYAIKYLHMKSGTPIAVGTLVSAGQYIGEVGNSGNSSGAHVHVEVFYLGTKSLSYYASNWDGDLAFGAGWGTAALKKTCDATGNSAPCRKKPQNVFGL